MNASSQGTDEVLIVDHLAVNLDGAAVLHDLSFAVRRRTLLAVIGPNGAGKSVLLKALIGALPHTGSIRWADGTKLGYVPQKLDIQRDLPVSGRDFLRAKVALLATAPAEVPAVLSAVGLDEAVLERPIGTLSGGQFQRLLIAFALLGKPTVLLLDEPAAGIDEPGQARLDRVIRQLQSSENITVLLVSHELSVVLGNADQVLCLSRTHTCLGPPRELLTPDLLEQIYGAPVSLHVHGD